MNPIALGLVIFGVALLLFGLLLALRHRKASGIAISLLGIGIATIPFIASYYLVR
jgi:hypothetical protein